jgi:hypothetical protein
MTPPAATYEPRDPSRTVLSQVIAEHLETLLASLHDDPDATGLPAYVQRELYDYLHCGILAYGFLRLGCESCQQEVLLAFRCKRRGLCASCAGRRMAQTAAHLVEGVMPWVPTRPWGVSVPMPLRSWTAPSRDLTAQVHAIIRTTIAPFSVNQAVTRGAKRHNVQPGSVTFLQRFGGALQLNLHDHVIVIEGVFLDRTDQGCTPRFLKGEGRKAPSAHTVAEESRPAMPMWHTWSRRSVGESSARCVGWGTWKPAWRPPWPPGMIRCVTTNRNLPAPWQPRSRNASPVANGLERQYAASVRVLALKASGLNAQARAVPV